MKKTEKEGVCARCWCLWLEYSMEFIFGGVFLGSVGRKALNYYSLNVGPCRVLTSQGWAYVEKQRVAKKGKIYKIEDESAEVRNFYLGYDCVFDNNYKIIAAGDLVVSGDSCRYDFDSLEKLAQIFGEHNIRLQKGISIDKGSVDVIDISLGMNVWTLRDRKMRFMVMACGGGKDEFIKYLDRKYSNNMVIIISALGLLLVLCSGIGTYEWGVNWMRTQKE